MTPTLVARAVLLALAACVLAVVGGLKAASSLVQDPERALLDARPGVRRAAVAVLAVRGPASAEALVEALWDADPAVREAATRALADLGRPAVPALVEGLADERLRNLRPRCAAALGRMGSAGAGAVPALLDAAVHEDPVLRLRAVDALGRVGGRSPVAVIALTARLATDSHVAVRHAAATALGRLGSPAAVPALVQALADEPSPVVRHAAARALGSHDGETATTALVRALITDSDEFVRLAAARSLEMGGRAAPVRRAALEAALDDDSERVRQVARQGLGAF